MIPSGVNTEALSEQMRQDKVAFGSAVPYDDADYDAMVHAVEEANNNGDGSVAVAIINAPVDKAADLRDLAQELQMSTGFDTVLVRTPHMGASVSDIYSRAELESAKSAFADVPVEVGVVDFIGEAEKFQILWPVVGVVVLVAMACFAVVTWYSLRSRPADG